MYKYVNDMYKTIIVNISQTYEDNRNPGYNE